MAGRERDGKNVNFQPVPNLNLMKTSSTVPLIVVSNRLPMTLQKTEEGWKSVRSSGGLASAMNPLLAKNGGEWIGWAGTGSGEGTEERRAILSECAEKDHCF